VVGIISGSILVSLLVPRPPAPADTGSK